MVTEANGTLQSQELETFLPQDGKPKGQIVSSITKLNTAKDVESAEYDPFTERVLENPTSNMDTLTHLLKASLGTGILAMPKAFKCAGLGFGVFFTLLVALICTHCSYILVKCAHALYVRTKRPAMSFPEVAHAALDNGPAPLRRFAEAARIFILVSLFATYFGTCSVYTVIVAKNIMQVVEYYMGGEELEIRLFVVALLVPLILMAWVRNLKYLAPVSMIANAFMGLGLGITMYYLTSGVIGGAHPSVVMAQPPREWPEFFSLTIFAMEAIGVVMPLENAMRTPRSLLGGCGVLNRGMGGVTLVYLLLGALGYACYGDRVEDSITLNLDIALVPAQIVKVAIALAVYCTFGLQFFVCVEIAFAYVRTRCTKRPVLADYVMRTVMVTACVLLAAAVPTIAPFMGVIGAFCFSLLGLLAPALLELVTFWEEGLGRGCWLLWKNVLVCLFGLFALIFGTMDAVHSIVAVYTQ